ncbi:MAG: hypothetical protein AAF682_04695 [Planctomycetota bacterium]
MQRALLALSLLAAPALAGGGDPLTGGPPFLEAWVDPCAGVDPPPAMAAMAVGDPTMPFLTIEAALAALTLAGADPVTPGLVHAMPGVYGPIGVGGNGEDLPITMLDNIHIQGVGAKRCIIRGDQAPPLLEPWVPVVPLGSRMPFQYLVDMSGLSDDPAEPFEEMIDGFTFQGGHIQVYAETEVEDLHGRVSNCVFDMLDYASLAGDAVIGLDIPGPEFGVLMVHVYDDDVLGYNDIRMKVFHNTFIHGWDDQYIQNIYGTTLRSTDTAVSICDVTNTLHNDSTFEGMKFEPDDVERLRGIGNPSIQNNLIRYIPGNPHISMLGIDSEDTSVDIGAPVGPTNFFDEDTTGGTNGVYISAVLMPLMLPEADDVADGYPDPGFVGEMLSWNFGELAARDWRLLQDSVVVNEGSTPVDGVLRAVNGTTYVRPALIESWSDDFDGEGYGNFRNMLGGTDIGFDEVDVVTMAGGYLPDSRTYGPGACAESCTPAGLSLGSVRYPMFPAAGAWTLFQTTAPIPGAPAWAVQPGVLDPPLLLPGLAGASSLLWLIGAPLPPVVAAGTTVTLVLPSPGPGGPLHVVNTLPLGVGLPFPSGACEFVNEQMLLVPDAGEPLAPGAYASNLQQSIDG